MSRRLIFSFAALTTLAACPVAQRPLTPEGANVRFMKSDPDASCKEIGMIVGETPNGRQPGSDEEKLELSKNDARNQAAEKGANYLRWDTANNDGSRIAATAFACPAETMAAH